MLTPRVCPILCVVVMVLGLGTARADEEMANCHLGWRWRSACRPGVLNELERAQDLIYSEDPLLPILALEFPTVSHRLPAVGAPDDAAAAAKANDVPAVALLPFPDGSRFKIEAKRLDGDSVTGLEVFQADRWTLLPMEGRYANQFVRLPLYYTANTFGNEIIPPGTYDVAVWIRIEYVYPNGKRDSLECRSTPRIVRALAAPRDRYFWRAWMSFRAMHDPFTPSATARSQHLDELVAFAEKQKAPIDWPDVGDMAYGLGNAALAYKAFSIAYEEHPENFVANTFESIAICRQRRERFQEVAAKLGKSYPVKEEPPPATPKAESPPPPHKPKATAPAKGQQGQEMQ